MRRCARRQRSSRILGAAAVVVVALAAGQPALARDPALAAYSSDHNRLFWFIHVTDVHIGWPVSSTQNLKLVAQDAFKIINPSFILDTGDLTDLGFLASNWTTYSQILQSAGHTAKTYFDLPGNHDAFWDSNLSNYLTYSIQGKANGTTHHSWVFDFPFGSYQIIGVNTSNGSLPQSEVSFTGQSLQAHPEARLALVCGHHPLQDVDAGGGLQQLLEAEKVSAYVYGHTHQSFSGCRVFTSGGVLLWLGETLGKPLSTLLEAEYNIFAVDNDGLSIRPVTIKLKDPTTFELPWPVVLITAPLDLKQGGGNPYAYKVSQTAKDNPIRALVFSDVTPSQVTASIDNGNGFFLKKLSGPLWHGTFDGTQLSAAPEHTLTVTAYIGGSKSDGHTVTFQASASSACSDGTDNDGDSLTDYPADPGCTGLFDTDETDPPPLPDAGIPDAAVADASVPDAGVPDTPGSAPDAVTPDTAGTAADAGAVEGLPGGDHGPLPPSDGGCGCELAERAPPPPSIWWLLVPLLVGCCCRRVRGPAARRDRSRRAGAALQYQLGRRGSSQSHPRPARNRP
jgi:hypothetical protein